MSLINAGPAEASPTRPWPAERIEHWPIERLIPYANNPRLHSEADVDSMAASILKWGWTNPALVDENGTLIAGHCRIGAAVKLKLTNIPGDRCAWMERRLIAEVVPLIWWREPEARVPVAKAAERRHRHHFAEH